VAGILSLPSIESNEQVAKVAEDIRSGRHRILARINFESSLTSDVHTGRWSFDTDTLIWCNDVFKASIPCDCLVIDEIGPLEFNQSQGFLEALAALDSMKFSAAFVVIRPRLLALAQQRWPTGTMIEISSSGDAEQRAQEIAENLSGIRPFGP
jgi:nucleoside-triphosphatase THEP1